MTTARESRPGGYTETASEHFHHNGHNGHQLSGLRAALESAGGSLKSLTVLAPQNDPFRVDTDAGHRDGSWLANTLDRLGVTGQRHLRGLHYILIGQPKPNGQPYTNTESDWRWLAENAAKCARWLSYIPFNRIVDQRNDEPVIRKWTPPDPDPYVSVDFEIALPDAEDLTPKVQVAGFTGAQPSIWFWLGKSRHCARCSAVSPTATELTCICRLERSPTLRRTRWRAPR